MKNHIVALVTGSLLFVGAGCSNQPAATPVVPNTEQTNTTPATNETTLPTQSEEAIALSGEATLVAGEVKLQWNAPMSMEQGNLFQLTNSAQPGKTVAGGAFWQNVGPSTREYIWSGVKTGKRYFRVCVLKEGSCVNESNEIEVVVK